MTSWQCLPASLFKKQLQAPADCTLYNGLSKKNRHGWAAVKPKNNSRLSNFFHVVFCLNTKGYNLTFFYIPFPRWLLAFPSQKKSLQQQQGWAQPSLAGHSCPCAWRPLPWARNSICHPLLAPCFCLFQGFQVLGQDSGVSWVCLFQGWPLHPLPSFLPGLGSGPMTKLPPLFVGGPFRLVHLFQDFPVQGRFSNPLGFSKPSLGDQAFPNPKPCFSSRAFPSPPTATSYKWCCSCMCWLWSVVTNYKVVL